MKRILTSIIVAAALSTPALAADMAPAYKAPPLMPAYSWTGFYIGGNIGGAWDHINWTFLDNAFWNDNPGDHINFTHHSLLGGAQVGFNYQINRFVIGVEGAWSATSLSQTVVSPFFPTSDHETTKVKNLYTVAARAGVTFNQFLIYGKGGWAGGQVELSAVDDSSVFWNSGRKNKNGWVAGAGAEYMLTPNIIVGIEYDHIDLGSATFSALNTGDNTFLTTVSEKTRIDSFVGRLSYKFGPF